MTEPDASGDPWGPARRAWSFPVDEEALRKAPTLLGLDASADFGEVYLALGCDAGHPKALAAFETSHVRAARQVLQRQGATTDQIDETLQRLREALLLRKPGEPSIRLLRYAGSGRLVSLVRVSAVRMLAYLRRHVTPESSTVQSTVDSGATDGLVRELWSRSDPEVHVIEDGQQRLFKACFATAVAALSGAERALLLFYFVEELTYQQIADLFGVNRSTICRQLNGASNKLLERITAEWQRRTGSDVGADLADLLDGELNLSMSRLLRA